MSHFLVVVHRFTPSSQPPEQMGNLPAISTRRPSRRDEQQIMRFPSPRNAMLGVRSSAVGNDGVAADAKPQASAGGRASTRHSERNIHFTRRHFRTGGMVKRRSPQRTPTGTIRTHFDHVMHRNFQYVLLINYLVGDFGIDIDTHQNLASARSIVTLLHALGAHNPKQGIAALSIVNGDAPAIAAVVL